MDFKARETSWLSKASTIFSKGTGVILPQSSCKDSIKRYRNVLHKKTKIWWTSNSLERYCEQEIIPRGLRIHLYPSFDLEQEDLILRWQKAAAKCSFEFMKIINEKNKITLLKLEEEIKELEEGLQKDLSKDDLQELFASLDKDFERWEKEISTDKLKKYQRDIQDFESKKIYKWQIKKESKMATSRFASNQSLNSASESNVSTSGSEGPRDPSYNGYRGKRKGYDIFNPRDKRKDGPQTRSQR
ncbi:uncharacterized protein ACNLHF_015754 [Anomaloglossus baeobatrachus]|uniref:uncharacterized protein LOC142301345 n=1 Tax=Anomaloglossus baeobatrachus TaxID=238106 RepID=UPI003F4F4330